MANNNIAVTLTADDQATEIVRRLAAAVKQLSDQQKANSAQNDDATKKATAAAGAFDSFKNAILGVAAAFGAIRVAEFVKDTITATEEIGKLAQKTGATTESLSILAVAAQDANVSQEELSNGLKFLSRAVEQLQQGVPRTVEAFAAFGLTAKDLKGLSLDQVLLKIATAQARFADGAGKAAASMLIFGRDGSTLIPLLNDLAGGGFDEATKKAEELGLVISANDVVAARDFNVALKDVSSAFRGLVISMAPVIKGLADIAKGFADLIAKHGDLIQFAVTAGVTAFAINKIVDAVIALRAAIAAGGIASLFTVPGLVIAGFALLAAAIGLVVTKILEARDAQKALDHAALDKDPSLEKFVGATAKPDVSLVDPAQRKALIDAQLAAVKQGLADELAATQSGLKLVEQQDDEAFAQGLISLREFYAERVQITKQGVAAQISELEAQKQALSASPLPENTDAARVTRAKDLKALEDQIALAKLNGQTQVLALLEQERTARLRIADEVRGFQAQILTAQGNNFAAAQVQIAALQQRFTLALEAQGGQTADAIKAQVDQLGRLLTLRAQFAQADQRANEEQTSLDLAKAAIQNQVAQGLISERDGQLQIAAVERQRLPTLQNLADQMDKFAADVGDPALVQQAEKFRASFQGIGQVIDESTIKLANLRETLLQNVQSDLSTFLGSTISQVHGLADAFLQLGTAIVSSFQRVLGDIIATKAVEAIRGIFEGAATEAPQVAAATATTTAASALGLAGSIVLTGASELLGASAALDVSGGTLIAAAAALGAAAAALAVGGGVGGLAALFTTFGIAGLASGGPVFGPGTGTSDSILARLSHGEYVIRADAVRRIGVPFLDFLNGLRMPSLTRPQFSRTPAFASGGFVTAPAGGGGSASGSFEATVGLEDGLVLKHLNTRGGLKGLLKIVSANPNAFKGALGLT